MFHFYLTVAYILPNIYVFFRINYLFISKGHRLLYSGIYLLTAAIYPVSLILPEEGMGFFMKMLSVAGGYLLAFFLYLFLCIILYDLFLLLNLAFKLLSAKIRKSFSFRSYTLSIMILLSAIIVVAGAINLNTIRVSKYEIKVPRRDSDIDHLRIAFVSDLHLQQDTRPAFIEQFVRKVSALDPDLMLYGGDMTEGDSENESTEAVESMLKQINARYGVYGVTGNHEFYGGQGNASFFRKAGIILLCDTMLRIGNSFYLAGRYDQHYRKRKTAEEILGREPFDLPVIVVDHRPTELQEISLTGADVQFSGHTHNGQLFPFNLITSSIYELGWGYKKIRNTHFFVSSGLRLWGPPVKTAGKSEIMVVDIYFI
jgi:predicted MPP superfamily phosphohydrolase